MDRDNASDLLVFLAVARERSFTRAAARLGMSQSALSHIIRALEERIGIRLLNRTTRSVTPTQAGERLLRKIGPKFEEMDVELAALSELREKPAGTIRVTATEYAAHAILLPALATLLPNYPDIKVEVFIDYGLTNIVAAQYDAGIRPGELVAKDMIAVRVGPDPEWPWWAHPPTSRTARSRARRRNLPDIIASIFGCRRMAAACMPGNSRRTGAN